MREPEPESSDNEQQATNVNEKLAKISGTARVARVTSKYAYITSGKYGSIFMLPKSVAHHFMNPNTFIDLAKFLRVDEIVHFTAKRQTNAQNNCRWLATKVTKASVANLGPMITADDASSSSSCHESAQRCNDASSGSPCGSFKTPSRPNDLDSRSDNLSPLSSNKEDSAAGGVHYSADPVLPNLTGNEPELITNVKGVVFDVRDKFGYLMTRDYGRIYLPLSACFCGPDDRNLSEFQKLSDSFLVDDVLMFEARRQPEKNGCRYAVERIIGIVNDAEAKQLLGALALSGPWPIQPLRPASSASYCSSDTIENESVESADPMIRVGEIYKLCPQFGFVKSYKLGNVYFTLSNYAGLVGDDPEALSVTPASLQDVLSIGDRVQFCPSRQPEKNGCRWRACRLQKLPVQPMAQNLAMDTNGIGASDVTTSLDACSQTDQRLWNAFLAAQSAPGRRPNVDIGVQTTPPPETMLLNALKRDLALCQTLKQRFPDLMRYVSKNA